MVTADREQAWWDTARAQWPQLELERAEFVAFVEGVLRDAADLSAETIDAAECFVACACGRGDARAIRAFEDRYAPAIRSAVRGQADAATLADEIRQRLATRLFVAVDGQPPKIVGYAGRGRLAGLVALAARREVARIAKQGERIAPAAFGEEAHGIGGAAAGLELRSAFATDLRGALSRAWHELEPREATLLRLRYLEGLTPTSIARVYQTHRTTVARWIAQAEHRLADATRRTLRTEHGVSGDTLESLIRDVQSDLSVSLRSLLTPPPT